LNVTPGSGLAERLALATAVAKAFSMGRTRFVLAKEEPTAAPTEYAKD